MFLSSLHSPGRCGTEETAPDPGLGWTAGGEAQPGYTGLGPPLPLALRSSSPPSQKPLKPEGPLGGRVTEPNLSCDSGPAWLLDCPGSKVNPAGNQGPRRRGTKRGGGRETRAAQTWEGRFPARWLASASGLAPERLTGAVRVCYRGCLPLVQRFQNLRGIRIT